MLAALDKLNITETSKLFVLMLLIFLSCLTSTSGQNLTTLEVEELFKINALQTNTPSVELLSDNRLGNWILFKGNANIVAQSGNGNQTLIEQVRGVGNVAKILQQGHNNKAGFECAEVKDRGIYQFGSKNYTEIKQFGNHNKSETFQYGNSNETNIVQHGEIVHFNDYKSYINKSIVLQIGNDNSAAITQNFYP